ncbi:MAG: hypothetical protein QXY83_01160 [Thermosphaera sp.]
MLAALLAGCEPGSLVAMETVGNLCWIIDEVEKAGCSPGLLHLQAKFILGAANKTDKLGVQGALFHRVDPTKKDSR